MATEIVRMSAVPTYYKETLSRVDAYRQRYNRLIAFDRSLQDAMEELHRKWEQKNSERAATYAMSSRASPSRWATSPIVSTRQPSPASAMRL